MIAWFKTNPLPYLMKKPVVALTMGDPSGVGPEVCLKAAADPLVRKICIPLIFGDAAVLAEVGRCCRIPLPEGCLSLADFRRKPTISQSSVIDFGLIAKGAVQPGRVQASCGLAAFRYIETAIQFALDKTVAAVATAPINKEALNLAGINFPGHTEIFASRTCSKRTCMLLASETMACGFVTTHLAYAAVPPKITRKRVRDVIELTAEAVSRLRGRSPRITVCGLNPHAGEHGLFGREESVISQAMADAEKEGIRVAGPLPPDAAFIDKQREQTDAYICMYHDQGHIPFKMLSFETGVNITLGLPIVRTSVDHGTAFDIAWQGKASHRSMVQAVRYAVKLSRAGESRMLVKSCKPEIRRLFPQT